MKRRPVTREGISNVNNYNPHQPLRKVRPMNNNDSITNNGALTNRRRIICPLEGRYPRKGLNQVNLTINLARPEPLSITKNFKQMITRAKIRISNMLNGTRQIKVRTQSHPRQGFVKINVKRGNVSHV